MDASATNVTVTEGAHSGDGIVTITFLDSVAPTANPTLNPAPNAAGWNDSAVTVSWGWSDDGAGIDAANCTQQSTSTGEGVQQLTASCSDLAGNTASDTVTVKVDTTDPTVSVTTPADAASYQVHQQVDAAYTCTDTGSGIDTCTGPVPSGSAVDTSTIGSKTFTVTGTDRAGNTTTTTVHYTVTSGPAVSIAATDGGGQAVKTGTDYPTPLAATVTDADTNPVPAAVVTWTITSGSATFPGGQSTANALTDASGVATAPTLTAGTTGGPVSVHASTPAWPTPRRTSSPSSRPRPSPAPTRPPSPNTRTGRSPSPPPATRHR